MTDGMIDGTELSIASDFSRFPAGRYLTDGKFSGEKFREMLLDRLGRATRVTVVLDGTLGYGSSFLEEAFGGLVRLCGFKATELHTRLDFRASDASLVKEIWSYIDAAKPKR